MNRLVELGLRAEDGSGEILFILPPRKRLLLTAAILYSAEILLIGVTINYLIALVTVPVMLFWIYYYYVFCKIWTAYYSRFYLVAVPILCIPVSFALMWLIISLLRGGII